MESKEQYVITGKKTVHVSEDHWERQTLALIVDGDFDLKALTAWVIKNQIDRKSIQLLIPTNNGE